MMLKRGGGEDGIVVGSPEYLQLGERERSRIRMEAARKQRKANKAEFAYGTKALFIVAMEDIIGINFDSTHEAVGKHIDAFFGPAGNALHRFDVMELCGLHQDGSVSLGDIALNQHPDWIWNTTKEEWEQAAKAQNPTLTPLCAWGVHTADSNTYSYLVNDMNLALGVSMTNKVKFDSYVQEPKTKPHLRSAF